MSTRNGPNRIVWYSKEQVETWDSKTRVMPIKSTLRLYKILVFCFIAKEDFKHFKKGYIDINYNKPALNSPSYNKPALQLTHYT